jgi:hypothetical protein
LDPPAQAASAPSKYRAEGEEGGETRKSRRTVPEPEAKFTFSEDHVAGMRRQVASKAAHYEGKRRTSDKEVRCRPSCTRSLARSQVRRAAPFSLTAFLDPSPPLSTQRPWTSAHPRTPAALATSHRHPCTLSTEPAFPSLLSPLWQAMPVALMRMAPNPGSQCPPPSHGILPNGVLGAALHAPSTAHAVGVSATRPSQPTTPPTSRTLPAGPGCRMGLQGGHQGPCAACQG